MDAEYDLIVIGAGSGGLVAARLAAQFGARVALVEKDRIGGDCTWTGCVPSKALPKAAKVAHTVRTANAYGVHASAPVVDMPEVRAYVRKAIEKVYQYETLEQLTREGVAVIIGAARFMDARTIQIGEQRLTSIKFLIATGAHPHIPNIPGLSETPFMTHGQFFDNAHLPARLIVIGSGPLGVEIAQAYQRLGSQVHLIGERLLLREEPEAAEVITSVLKREGMLLYAGKVTAARQEQAEIVVCMGAQEIRGDLLLVAAGRAPNISELTLENAGVAYSAKCIEVDDFFRTSAKHIYAIGDCTGGYQFTHLAAWQAARAVQNALLRRRQHADAQVLPWTTFTDPEVARVGMSESQARERYGDEVRAAHWNMSRTDRAVCENDMDGFIKVLHKADGTILGATVVSARAGEVITEFALALEHGLKLSELAKTIHVYPTYSTPVMRLAAQVSVTNSLGGIKGKAIRELAQN